MTTATETGRRLATVETITEIAPIPDADAIVRARIRGWDVVVKKDEFAVGDPCVYFEVDAMLDVEDPRFEFLAPRGVRTDADGRKGHVLKTAKLRGQYSQGLALPLAAFPEIRDRLGDFTFVGADVTTLLGVWKWEPPIPVEIAGQVRGMRPGWIPATDEERVQNVPQVLSARDYTWVATEKIDGTSCTFWVDGEDYGVCSRNLDLLPSDANTLWRIARELDIHNQIAFDLCEVYEVERAVLQGEVFGEGIQGNPLKMKGQHFRLFTVRLGGSEIPRAQWPDYEWLQALSVPVLDLPFPADDLDGALDQVDGLRSSLADRPAEGVVWRAADSPTVVLPDGQIARGSFKCLNNAYLLKHDR